jgi:hypothetical protein
LKLFVRFDVAFIDVDGQKNNEQGADDGQHRNLVIHSDDKIKFSESLRIKLNEYQ